MEQGRSYQAELMSSGGLVAKSLVYLAAFTGVGWVLMKVTEPKGDKKRVIQESSSLEHLSDAERKKRLIVLRLKEAAGVSDSDK